MLKGRVRRDIQGDIARSELSTCKVMATLARIPAAAVAGGVVLSRVRPVSRCTTLRGRWCRNLPIKSTISPIVHHLHHLDRRKHIPIGMCVHNCSKDIFSTYICFGKKVVQVVHFGPALNRALKLRDNFSDRWCTTSADKWCRWCTSAAREI